MSVRHVSRTGAVIRELGSMFADSVRETWRTMLVQPTAKARFFRGYRWRVASKAQSIPVRDQGTFRRQFANSEQSPLWQGIQKTRLSSSADSRNMAHRQQRAKVCP
jgi:hypothetical protein